MKSNNVQIVLVNPSHPGNIGAAARAMKTMGLSRLCLVNPKKFPDPEATVRASGADDILSHAKVVDNLQSALQGCQVVIGASVRSRHLTQPVVTPRQCAATICAAPGTEFAVLFGREKSGLTNEELAICHQHLVIATNPEFSSLNLAAAVQVVSYELLLAQSPSLVSLTEEARALASADQVIGFYQHLEATLTAIRFLDPKQPKLLMQRLQRLFNRAELDSKEINILRGMLSRIDRIV